MLTVGDTLPSLTVPVQQGSALPAGETLNLGETNGKWKVLFFWPKDFTFVCPTEIAEFARLSREFEDRDAVVLGGSTDNEFSKLAWRRDHKDLNNLPMWSFADNGGRFARELGILNQEEGVAQRATFVVDPDGTVQHVYVTNLNVGRNPQDTLRVLDALQTDELCPCNREVGGEVLRPAA